MKHLSMSKMGIEQKKTIFKHRSFATCTWYLARGTRVHAAAGPANQIYTTPHAISELCFVPTRVDPSHPTFVPLAIPRRSGVISAPPPPGGVMELTRWQQRSNSPARHAHMRRSAMSRARADPIVIKGRPQTLFRAAAMRAEQFGMRVEWC